MDFIATSFVMYTEIYIVLHIFCLLTSIEPILKHKGRSLLYLPSNDMNCQVISTNIMVIAEKNTHYYNTKKCYYNTQSIRSGSPPQKRSSLFPCHI